MTRLDRTVTARPRLSRREDLLTMVFGSWLIVGIFVDGWAHNNDKPETFFTPWHALFYSGFAVTASWICWQVYRHWSPGAGAHAVPVGYGLGLLGVAVFAAGGIADMVWHEIFGIEVDLEALLSPSHLVLFVGGLLVVSSPLRAAWSDPSSRAPSFRQFLPALLSATLTTLTVAFFFMTYSPWLTGAATEHPYRELASMVPLVLQDYFVEEVQLEGFSAILITTIILMAPTLLMARRWRLPAGSLTLLFTSVATVTASIESFDMGPTFAAAVVAGVVGDVLVRHLQPTPLRPWAFRTFGALVPLTMWLAYFGIMGGVYTLGWSVELWAGISCMAALTGLGLALLVLPPAIPFPPDPPEALDAAESASPRRMMAGAI